MRRGLFALNLAPPRKFGSLEEQVAMLARAFQEETGVFVPLFNEPLGPEEQAACRDAGMEAEGLDLRRFRLTALFQLWRLVRRHRIEVVHWNFYDPLKNGYLWALSVLAPRVAHVYTDHISRPSEAVPRCPLLKRLGKGLLFRRYEQVVCVSEFVRRSLRTQVSWLRAVVCVHFINTDRFRPNPAARAAIRRARVVDGKFVLLLVGQLRTEKGVEIALRALRKLPDDVVLWVVGEGDERARLAARSRAWGLGPRVRFLGMQRHVEPFMQAADCLVCPSVWAEAAGLVILEAQACGLPVLASRIGGIPEFVEDGQTGLLFPPGDAATLAEHVQRLQRDPAARQAMGEAARAAAVERYSSTRGVPDYLQSYRSSGHGWNHAAFVRQST